MRVEESELLGKFLMAFVWKSLNNVCALEQAEVKLSHAIQIEKKEDQFPFELRPKRKLALHRTFLGEGQWQIEARSGEEMASPPISTPSFSLSLSLFPLLPQWIGGKEVAIARKSARKGGRSRL